MKFKKKKYRLKFYENIKFFIIIFTLIVIFQIYNIPKNVLKIFKLDYENRLVNSYDYCNNESIGFLNYIKKKYNFDKNIEIKNFFSSPNPTWFFNDIGNKDSYEDKLILLGYKKNETINFYFNYGEFISTKDLKEFNNLSKITFNYNGSKVIEKIKYVIHLDLFGKRKKIFTSNINSILPGENIINLNENFLDEWKNVRLAVKFFDDKSDKIVSIDSLKIYQSNPINLNNYIINEQYKDCYLISKK